MLMLKGLALSRAYPIEEGIKGPKHIVGVQPGLAYVGLLEGFTN